MPLSASRCLHLIVSCLLDFLLFHSESLRSTVNCSFIHFFPWCLGSSWKRDISFSGTFCTVHVDSLLIISKLVCWFVWMFFQISNVYICLIFLCKYLWVDCSSPLETNTNNLEIFSYSIVALLFLVHEIKHDSRQLPDLSVVIWGWLRLSVLKTSLWILGNQIFRKFRLMLSEQTL
jgi:hypothetical protein